MKVSCVCVPRRSLKIVLVTVYFIPLISFPRERNKQMNVIVHGERLLPFTFQRSLCVGSVIAYSDTKDAFF